MIRNTLSNWIANAVYVKKGERLEYGGRAWLPAIFDTYAPFGKIALTSRQVGKSTLGSAIQAAYLSLFDNFNILYIAPSKDQTQKYSQDKVKPMVEESPILRMQIGTYNNIFEKEFKRGGKLYMKYASTNADRCRGITADMNHYDEIQDQSLDLIEPVINETMFTSKHKIKLWTGTPKSKSNPAHKRWLSSDRREWLVWCRHHLPAKRINLGIRNIGKHGPICHHCGNLLDVDDGEWVAHNPGAKIVGFHIGQLHARISHRTQRDWDELINKYETYERNLFLNEVLGISADNAEQPLTEEMLKKACLDSLHNSEEPDPSIFKSERFAGIDWGHGAYTTCITIGQMDINGRFKTIYMRAFEGAEQCSPEYVIPELAAIINTFQCARAHVDYGGGFGMWDELVKKVPRTSVTGMMWTNTKETRWHQSYKDGNDQSVAYSIPMLSMNKVAAVTTFLRQMREGSIKFIREQDFFAPHYGDPRLPSNREDKNRTFAAQFMNLRKEHMVEPDTGLTKTRFLRDGPDDALQATIYCWAIAKMHYATKFQ